MQRGGLLTVGTLPTAVPKLPAQVAGAQALCIGAAVGHVPAAAAPEAAHGRVLKVLVKVPGRQSWSCQNLHALEGGCPYSERITKTSKSSSKKYLAAQDGPVKVCMQLQVELPTQWELRMGQHVSPPEGLMKPKEMPLAARTCHTDSLQLASVLHVCWYGHALRAQPQKQALPGVAPGSKALPSAQDEARQQARPDVGQWHEDLSS